MMVSNKTHTVANILCFCAVRRSSFVSTRQKGITYVVLIFEYPTAFLGQGITADEDDDHTSR